MRDVNKYKEIRSKVVEQMKETLASTTRCDAPRWLITAIIVPVFIWEVIKLLGRVVVAVATDTAIKLATICAAPFVAFYVVVDTVMILRWFFARAIDKMSGEL